MGKVIKGKWKGVDTDAKTAATNNAGKIYQIRISLVDSDPEIWRRVLVSGDTTLGKLHRIIQTAMGWTDSHLHEFVINGVSYADPDPEMEMDGSRSENRARLYQVAPKVRSSFIYIYDFGDGWEHSVTVEKIVDQDEGFTGKPVCLEGQSSCPPEDCGGIGGFYTMLETINDPKDPEYENMLEWLGDDFDPDEFNLQEINEILRKIK